MGQPQVSARGGEKRSGEERSTKVKHTADDRGQKERTVPVATQPGPQEMARRHHMDW